MKTDTYILPSYWAPALINGDYSGLTDEEAAEIDQWLTDQPEGWAVDVSETFFFSHRNDANNVPGDCAEFTFIIN